jgi:hypothetical protein
MHRFIPAMSSITGARIAELKVRHHPRRFGESKYGLSRIYKVLLDLIAIKTITAFSPRALLWFSLLALPFALTSLICIIWSLLVASSSGQSIVVPSGLAIIYAGGAAFLAICGILSELVYRTGEIRPLDYLKILFGSDAAGKTELLQETRNVH